MSKGGNDMPKGILPVVLGVGVTTAGLMIKKRTVKQKYILDLASMAGSTLCGFGAAHVLLGTLDIIKHLTDKK